MYFLLCCFSVMQCQLSLFKGGYLTGRRDKACTQLRRYSARPAGSSEKRKGKKEKGGEEGGRGKKESRRRGKKGRQPAEEKPQPAEKPGLTMATEETHNANRFPNTTDCLPHKEEKGAAFSSLHFNKQHPHKTSQPLVLFGHKKNPRRSKRSHKKGEGFFSTISLFSPPPLSFSLPEREKDREGGGDLGGGVVRELIISVFEKETNDL
uniref:Uncharacterized protein n=1 Tax=Sphaerodactylus townsendi TaxID=933632 RepID=A0ACB8FKL5_9SAUR